MNKLLTSVLTAAFIFTTATAKPVVKAPKKPQLANVTENAMQLPTQPTATTLKSLKEITDLTIEQVMKDFIAKHEHAQDIKRAAEDKIRAIHEELAIVAHDLVPFGEIVKEKYPQYRDLYLMLLMVYEDMEHKKEVQALKEKKITNNDTV